MTRRPPSPLPPGAARTWRVCPCGTRCKGITGLCDRCFRAWKAAHAAPTPRVRRYTDTEATLRFPVPPPDTLATAALLLWQYGLGARFQTALIGPPSAVARRVREACVYGHQGQFLPVAAR